MRIIIEINTDNDSFQPNLDVEAHRIIDEAVPRLLRHAQTGEADVVAINLSDSLGNTCGRAVLVLTEGAEDVLTS